MKCIFRQKFSSKHNVFEVRIIIMTAGLHKNVKGVLQKMVTAY